MEEELYYKGKNFTINLDNEKELVSIEVWGVHDGKDAEDFKSSIFKLLEDVAEIKRNKILLDCSNIKRVEHDARRIYTGLAKELSNGPYIAIFGTNTIIGVVLDFVISASGREGVKFFKDKDKAINWLKKQK